MRIPSLLAAALFSCCIFPAAADDGKPRYVSGSGRDQGDCLNRFRPCRTLSYAIAQAGKGDSIQVAEGTYSISQSAQLFDLLSATGRVKAGFSKYSGYSEVNAREQHAAGRRAAGVSRPLRSRRLHGDRRHQGTGSEQRRIASHAQDDGASDRDGEEPGGRAVRRQRIGWVPVPVGEPAVPPGFRRSQARLRRERNDIWGYTDLNTGREYAFIGVETGVAILDITDPTAPEQVGAPTGTATTWRDIEIYQQFDAAAQRWRAFAYVVADNAPDPLMVLDLSGLPNGVEQVTFTSDHRSAHTNYMTNADWTYGIAQTSETPLLAIAGANLNGGNHRLYSLTNPRAPALISVSTSGYAHDLTSFPVKDARKNTQCVNASAQPVCQVLTDFNENTFDIWDVTDPNSRQLLVSQPYPNARYTHSGWWTEDGRYLFVHDELDERDFNLNTTVRVFDMANLRAPVLAGSWVGPTRAIDHNGYVRGNRYYFSNYSEGLTVLDITNPATPARVGFFDTFPATAELGFVGAWGTYPFFASGTIAISDINSGLYLVRDETLSTPRGAFSVASAKLSGTEGQALAINVNRSAGSGAVSVRLDVLYATASATDATLASTTLNWADGDASAKSATLNLASDAQDEDLELLMVRLVDPRGGADIAYPDTAQVTIADSGKSATTAAAGSSASGRRSAREGLRHAHATRLR